jgi:phage terminase large subunit GpA-like protein
MNKTKANASAVLNWQKGVAAFAMPPHLTLDEWARKYFYLSRESSYIEQRWSAWGFQRGIMSAISNDDVEEIDVIKSARVGYTKILVAATAYFAQHKKRNQAIWQPTDEDAEEFSKTEINPMLRDVEVMREIFPSYNSRDKDNTLSQKRFIGSMLYIKGGTAAKNYRRISVDVVYLDELDAFDADIESEGSAVALSNKRTEGASFPKRIRGSTPKLKHFSQIEDCAKTADAFFRYHIACPHCGEYHALTWGGKDAKDGFKFHDRDPATTRHLCPHCGVLIEQHEYLAVADAGKWFTDDGRSLDNEGNFFDADGKPMEAPRHVAFHVWTAYSPNVTWASITREFFAAYEQMQVGDSTKMQAFTNTTLGETWDGASQSTDAVEIIQRAEPYKLGIAPVGVLVLLAGIDTQDDRLECSVWGYGRGCESWLVDHVVFFGNPAQDDVWSDLEKYLFGEFERADGATLRITATAIDTQGHNTQSVYAWCYKQRARRNVYAIAGRSGREKAINSGSSLVDINHKGKRLKNGVRLWQVGTNLAKDLILSRLNIAAQGAGYVHFSDELPEEWFKQFTGEKRYSKRTATGEQTRWTAHRKRVEALDCCVYATFLSHQLGLDKYGAARWEKIEKALTPKDETKPETTIAPKPRATFKRRLSFGGSFGGNSSCW